MHAVPMFRTYGKDDMCGAPANLESMPEGFIDPGYIYDAVSNTCTCSPPSRFETVHTQNMKFQRMQHREKNLEFMTRPLHLVTYFFESLKGGRKPSTLRRL
jgi:hypothetical protein